MDTKRRKHPLVEALQILKFLKQKRLVFTEGWTTAELDMWDNDVDDRPDLWHKLLIGAQGSSDKIMAAISFDDEDL